ncbi:MAG: hypothetical protein ACTHM5_06580, partial [Ginsengibacter sp.]
KSDIRESREMAQTVSGTGVASRLKKLHDEWLIAIDAQRNTPNPDFDQDKMMFELLGLKPRESFKESATAAETGFVENALIS